MRQATTSDLLVGRDDTSDSQGSRLYCVEKRNNSLGATYVLNVSNVNSKLNKFLLLPLEFARTSVLFRINDRY